jgi:hypothetical protein
MKRASAEIGALLFAAATLLACAIAEAPTVTPAETAVLDSGPTEIARPSETAGPLETATRAAQAQLPSWWPGDLPMPAGAEFAGDASRAVWSTHDANVIGIKDSFAREAGDAGYGYYSVTQSAGSIYDLYFVKTGHAYTINLTQGTDTTYITGSRVGIFHLTVSGAATLDMDLPMRSHLDTSPGSEVSIGTAIPGPACAECQYYVNVHIAPFNGPGTYDAKPGTYIIDVEVIPGGTLEVNDYRWAQNCTVNVVDSLHGSFQCQGLQNVNNQNQRIDASGGWTQP